MPGTAAECAELTDVGARIAIEALNAMVAEIGDEDVVADHGDLFRPAELACTAAAAAETSDEWEAKLSRLIEDADLRKKIGKAGRQIVTERYSQDIIFRKMISEIFPDEPIKNEPHSDLIGTNNEI